MWECEEFENLKMESETLPCPYASTYALSLYPCPVLKKVDTITTITLFLFFVTFFSFYNPHLGCELL